MKKKQGIKLGFLGQRVIEISCMAVLLLSAVSGYNRTIMAYRLNKQSEQITALITAGLNYAGQTPFSEKTNTISIFIKMNELPPEMIRQGINTRVYDIFNSEFYTRLIADENNIYTQLLMGLDQTKSEKQIYQICKNTFRTIKAFHEHLYYVRKVSPGREGKPAMYYGDRECTHSGQCLKDVNEEQIEDFCRYRFAEAFFFEVVWKENNIV